MDLKKSLMVGVAGCVLLLCCSTLLLAQSSQSGSGSSADKKDEKKTYTVENGTTSYSRLEESQRKKTADGEVETQRVRMPSYAGDTGVIMEREIRTRNLPDGTVEKEYVLKNPDGSGNLVPTEIIREKMKKKGESTTVERETMKPDYEGHWASSHKETMTEKGPADERRSVREVQEPSVAGGWRTVEREATTTKAAPSGTTSRAVRQIPDAYGNLSDYEIREQSTRKQGDKESGEVIVRRRDFQDTDQRNFYLVEKTTSEQTRGSDGKTVVKSTTESDVVAGGATRNTASNHPEVVEQRTTETSTKGGTQQTVTNVEQRSVADPRGRSSYQVIQQVDRNGNVRQIFIPSN